MQRQRNPRPRPRSSTTSLEHQRDDDTHAAPTLAQSTAMYAHLAARWLYKRRLYILLAIVATLLEIWWHVRSFDIPSPPTNLDPPFASQCTPAGSTLAVPASATPPDALEERENAVILMLARNSDVEGAVQAVRSLEEQWNKHFAYPYLFLNNAPFSPAFEDALRAATPSNITFDTIPSEMWSWPRDAAGNETPPRAAAEAAMRRMAAKGLPYAASEDYHHMCRFYSGFFAHHPALVPYDYFWRIEPDVRYTCRIPYDPFKRMRSGGKKYGFTLALWEIGATAPSLFRAVDEFRRQRNIQTGTYWTGMLDASTAPLPLRYGLMSQPSLFHSRTREGDAWNMCHFWSNFEIASLEFFRSEEYTSLFTHLDSMGGFFAERWGDAPVHSLAAALLLRDEEVHHFADFGYAHPPLQLCADDRGSGCDCACPDDVRRPQQVCLRKLRKGIEPEW